MRTPVARVPCFPPQGDEVVEPCPGDLTRGQGGLRPQAAPWRDLWRPQLGRAMRTRERQTQAYQKPSAWAAKQDPAVKHLLLNHACAKLQCPNHPDTPFHFSQDQVFTSEAAGCLKSQEVIPAYSWSLHLRSTFRALLCLTQPITEAPFTIAKVGNNLNVHPWMKT